MFDLSAPVSRFGRGGESLLGDRLTSKLSLWLDQRRPVNSSRLRNMVGAPSVGSPTALRRTSAGIGVVGGEFPIAIARSATIEAVMVVNADFSSPAASSASETGFPVIFQTSLTGCAIGVRYRRSGGLQWFVYCYGGDEQVEVRGPYAAASQIMHVVVRIGSELNVTFNGEAEVSASFGTYSAASGNINISNSVSLGGFTAAVTRLRVWNRTLSARDVRSFSSTFAVDRLTQPALDRQSAIWLMETPSRGYSRLGMVSGCVGDIDCAAGSFVMGWPGRTMTFTDCATVMRTTFETSVDLALEVPLNSTFTTGFITSADLGVLVPCETSMAVEFVTGATMLLSESLSTTMSTLFVTVAMPRLDQVLMHVDFEVAGFGEFPTGPIGGA